jgi:internalin A
VLPWQPGTPPRVLTLICRLAEPAPGLISWLTVRHHRALMMNICRLHFCLA